MQNAAAQSLTEIIKATYDLDVTPDFTRPEPRFGDLATNVALKLAGRLGKSPRDVAMELAEKLEANETFSAIEVAGPGFINFFLSDTVLLEAAQQKPSARKEGQTVVIEYSCPNAFKELHTGHLYQTIAGDILARMIERSGATVHRTSFGGDVGLHVAKCLWGMTDLLGGALPEKLEDIDASPFARAQWISQCYVRGAAAYEQNPDTKIQIDELNKAIYGFHDTDDRSSPLAQLYWSARQWSFDYFEAFYKLIKVDTMRYYPESETAPVGLAVVRDQLEKGNLKQSDGAVVFEGDESKHLHTRVFITSKGLPTYETKDIGVIWMEREAYQFDHRILITGNDQKEYMRVVFAAAELFRPELAGTMTHLTNGTVRFGDGSKMSSRLGNVSRAADVIDIVREKVKDLVEDQSLVEVVSLGAIKYVFAKYRLGGDIAFDMEETVSLNGNSGPYIQYAHARARSILAKSSLQPMVPSAELTSEERDLVRKLGEYAEIVEKATDELMPHHICSYLYELAQVFNRFYEKARIIGDEREPQRLWLAQRYADCLRDGLGLLGITAPDHL